MAMHYRFDKEKSSRKPGITPLKEAIDMMIDRYKLRSRFDQSYVVAHWDKIMGSASLSSSLFFYSFIFSFPPSCLCSIFV